MSALPGGPAYPPTPYQHDGSTHWAHGMSLRDYFAAHALAKAPMTTAEYTAANLDTDAMAQIMAIAAYRVADAMLKARKEHP